MLPIPQHLRDCIVPLDPLNDDKKVIGRVQCPCGSKVFEILYPGETHLIRGERYPVIAEFEGKSYFVVKGRCRNCGVEHLLLNIDHHGWDAVINYDEKQPTQSRPSLVAWTCLACGGADHEATIYIYSDGADLFIRGEWRRVRA